VDEPGSGLTFEGNVLTPEVDPGGGAEVEPVVIPTRVPGEIDDEEVGVIMGDEVAGGGLLPLMFVVEAGAVVGRVAEEVLMSPIMPGELVLVILIALALVLMAGLLVGVVGVIDVCGVVPTLIDGGLALVETDADAVEVIDGMSS
jgi:hypothetical protein